jgi:two-component system OmpR family sensor kinase
VPLRLRLTLVYVALLAGALVAFGVSVYLVTSSRISSNLDDRLRLEGDSIATTLQPIDPPLSAQTMRTNQWLRLDEEASSGILFQVKNLEGTLIYSSFPRGSLDVGLPKTTTAQEPFFATANVGGQSFRLQYQPIIQSGEMLGSVVVGEFLKSRDDALNLIRTALIFGGVGVLIIANVPAYLLAGRVLDPVRRVSRLARDIERTADFSRRVPPSAAGDEMAELTATFNSMVQRVERMLETQRAFLADSSHELRRPLTVLRTNLDILRDPTLPPEEREGCLQEMTTEAETMSQLLADLLLLSREGRQEVARAPVDCSSICDQAVNRLRSQDDRHELAAEIEAEVRVQGDEQRLGQMIWNLLANAKQYTPEGGRIELRLQRLNGLARLEVQDTGIGISEDDLPHIFDRFYRAEDARAIYNEGDGLGLAIVKYIVEAHDGSIKVTSHPGDGTTFAVDLPLAAVAGS